jgi:hypothetical protein
VFTVVIIVTDLDDEFGRRRQAKCPSFRGMSIGIGISSFLVTLAI